MRAPGACAACSAGCLATVSRPCDATRMSRRPSRCDRRAKVKHFAAFTKPCDVGALLRAIDGYTGHKVTVVAMRLSPHVLLRPGELRQAERTAIDFEAAIWSIPAERMKMRRPHRVPLSRKVLAMLEDLRQHTHWWKFLFPCLGRPRKAMSENAVNQGLRRLGYTTNQMTAHGFRAMAATLLNEMGERHPGCDRAATRSCGYEPGSSGLRSRRVLGRAREDDAALVRLPRRVARRGEDPEADLSSEQSGLLTSRWDAGKSLPASVPCSSHFSDNGERRVVDEVTAEG